MSGMHEVVEIRARHDAHAEQRCFILLPTRFPEQRLTETACAKRFWRDRSSASPCARCVSMDVGDPRTADELQVGMRLEERDHLRTGIEKRFDPFRIVVVAKLVFEIRPRKVRLFDDSVGLRERISRDPHPSAGPGGGSATDGVFFNHNHFQTMPGSRDCSRQAGGARADYQEVTIDLARPELERIVRTISITDHE